MGLCAITWDGKVATCALDVDACQIYGDVNELSIEQIWEKRNKELVSLQLNHEFNRLPEICQRCTDWTVIGEKRFDENGEPVKKSYHPDEQMIIGH